ncbi:hypothetical protein F0U61_41400 [Archangium violaceum]|uniref:hypothetical protein n=1 Tax=Archangium violaceum TaxID=83451 RepID=UPI002B2812BE|nr:hypothetical protein F0U61_41400 [Archangium violaceum]
MRTALPFRRVIGFFSLFLLAACNALPEEGEEALESDTGELAVPANFLCHQGKQLYLNGAPYQMVGMNATALNLTVLR